MDSCAPQILIWFTQDRASTRDAAHRALPCHARSRSHQDYDETLALASIQRLEDPARPVRAPCAGDRDCNERSTISAHDAGAIASAGPISRILLSSTAAPRRKRDLP